MKVRMGRREIEVKWTLADRLVDWLNPAAGMERLKGRVSMAAAGGYTGGKRDRRATRNWRPSQTSANEELSHDLPDLRARSRDLARNVPIATGAINTVVTSVVGDGLVLQAQVDREALGLTQEQAEAWQRQAEREFAIWAKRPDFCSRLNFDEYQALVLRAVLESGDLFVVRRRRRDPADTYGLKLQAIEADRCSNPNFGANNATRVDGVELDSDGVPVAYNFATRHPDDSGMGVKREWKKYYAGSSVTGMPQILHLYPQLRPEQARGIPYLSPVVDIVRQLGDYTEAEVRAAVISSMFTVFIKQPSLDDGNAPIVGATGGETSADPKTEIEMGNGAIVDLGPGEEPVFADPKRPNTAFDAFVTAMSRHIGVALELPYELLLKSFTASYSASRAALEQAWQMFRTRRSWLAWKFCQPVYEWVITEAVASGRLAAPGFFNDPVIREAWLGSDWIGPARIQLDPQKEASADLIDLGMGTKTRQQIIMERTGGSFEQKHQQLVREQRMRDEDGLAPTPASASAAMQPAETRQGADGAQDNQDGTEEDREDMQAMGRAFEMLAQAQVLQAQAAVTNAEKPAAHIHIPPIEIGSVRLDPGSIPAPIVNVAAPNVSVAAPAVTVEAPTVNVAAPHVTVEGRGPKTEKVTVTAHDARGRISEFIKQEL